MRTHPKPRLITQLLVGQTVLIVISGVTLVGTAMLVAPPIFSKHMHEAGIDTSSARKHITEAFAGSFSLSLVIAMLTALLVAAVMAWYLMRRIAEPIESLAIFAESLASGDSTGIVAVASSTPEIDRLSVALTGMSAELSMIQNDQARMLRDLAHELRTPIATIGALIDGIEDGVVKGDAHSWDTIRDQLQRLNRLSRDVRDVSHSYDQTLSNLKILVDPNEIGRSAIAAWSARFEKKGVGLETKTSGELSRINADPLRIGQVLSNLLENALRHTPKDGNVLLIIESVVDGVSFSVRDDGEGISVNQLPHIFDRLYRGDNARHSGDSGSGLGLTIARSIAESHSGTLIAMSKGRGRGSSFTLTIPTLGENSH